MNKKTINSIAEYALNSIFRGTCELCMVDGNPMLHKQMDVLNCKVNLLAYLEGLKNACVTIRVLGPDDTSYVDVTFQVNIVNPDSIPSYVIDIEPTFNKFIVYRKSESRLIKKYIYEYN